MTFDIPPVNLFFMISVYTAMDVFNEIQRLTFTTLMDQIHDMNNNTLRRYGIPATETSISMVNSIISTSATAGVFLAIVFVLPRADVKGRKYICVKLRVFLSCIISLFQLGADFAQSSELFVLGTLVGGANIVIRTYLTIIYVTECAPDKYRGFATTSFVFSDVIGQLFMFSVASPNVLGKPNTWFFFPLLALIGSLLMYLFALRLPESPKWLVQENRLDEARSAVLYYQGSKVDLDGVMTSLIRENNLTVEDKISLRQIWENETMRQAMKLVLITALFLSLTPILPELAYNLQLNELAGFTVSEALNINTILVFVFLPAKFVGTYLIDTLGRRPVLLIAALTMFVKNCSMMTAQWISFAVGPSWLTKTLLVLSESLTECYTATGVNGLGILYITEFFPPSGRTTAAQTMSLLNMVANLPLAFLFPVLNTIFPPANYFVFLLVAPIFLIYLLSNVPETKGRAVCDIIENLDERVMTRRNTEIEEQTPLLFRDRANTHNCKRNSILNTPRTRALTFDYIKRQDYDIY